ncbi:pyruvate dehydrogenase (acetyl-transferring) E1 component, alpha subunit [Thermobaculum terrenum ATCC BAA-798]|uniref:Pyruvate dehydrogenase E1 component subunit alpha n=2 Tax=Thermobaculum TaxID=262406 RepID=D1CDK6_THET1|nr:pyruvate dehydrogenase (acetyl-transferring) E1 component, alpha subunit [Thermobaculum terrenum ATCC BAA-798]
MAKMETRTENKEQLLELYRKMLLIRHFEERAAQLYTQAYIGGYCHLNVGEEATVVGALTSIREDDYVFTYYREHGHALTLGSDPKAVMAELCGKVTGLSKGRGGSMHLFDKKHRLYGGYGIVGGHLPLAVGAAMAIEYKGEDSIVMCLFGEGATNIGAFHEALNLAKVYHLPVLFFCVNNQYAMGARVDEDSAVPEMWMKACAYNMPAEKVDGMDLFAVREVTQRMVEKVRETREPMFLEAITYRFRGHSMADAGRYRTQEEVKQWMQRDPIHLTARRLEEMGVLDSELKAKIESEVEQEIEEATKFAIESPDPDVSDLYKYVYTEDGE